MTGRRWAHHVECACGCGELADQCSGDSPSVLGLMLVGEAQASVSLDRDQTFALEEPEK